jgi:uncharacterized membrane protein YccF (DUF307 family)
VLLNVIWLVFAGLWLAIAYAVVGLLLCVLIITIPFGLQCFKLARFTLWPFGRAVVRRPGGDSPLRLIGNVVWFVLVGIEMAIAHLITGLVLCLTIIGLPLGLANFKLIPLILLPFGREVVRRDQAYGPGVAF